MNAIANRTARLEIGSPMQAALAALALYGVARTSGAPAAYEIAAASLATALEGVINHRRANPAQPGGHNAKGARPVLEVISGGRDTEAGIPEAETAPDLVQDPAQTLAADQPANPTAQPERSGDLRSQSAQTCAALAPPVLQAPVLAKALARVAGIVETRNTIPVLSNVLLQGLGDRLRIVATDLDMEASETIAAPGVGEFAVTVPARQLLDSVKGAAREPITFSPEAMNPPKGKADMPREDWPVTHLALTVGAAATRLPVITAADFPIMVLPDAWRASMTCEAGALVDSLKAISPAMSTEEARYYLKGAYLHAVHVDGETRPRLVATDGHRLVCEDMRGVEFGDEGGLAFPGIIIPRKAILWIARHAPKAGTVIIEATAARVSITTEAATLVSKVVDGSFPDYCRVMPTGEGDTLFRGECRPTAAAIKPLLAISAERSRGIRLEQAGGLVEARVANMDGAAATGYLPVEGSGADLLIGFNARYVLDALALGERFVAHARDAGAPVRVEFPDKPGRIAILMPVRV